MSDIVLRGPSVTYVTDDSIDRSGQERILNEFIASAGIHPLRVGFRLPTWTDAEMQSLIEWYLNRVEKLSFHNELAPALIHDRPDMTNKLAMCSSWLPWRNRDLLCPDDIGRAAISVHSVRDAHEAISMGAGELVFGPVFATESQPGQPGRGVRALAELVESTEIYENPPRVTVIGGIDENSITEMGRLGHEHVACTRVISGSSNITETLNHLRSGWVAARINAEIDESRRTPFGNPSSFFF